MIFKIIAAYRGRKAHREHGYHPELNPYKPKIGTPDDCWTTWYEAHRGEEYKRLRAENPSLDWHTTTLE